MSSLAFCTDSTLKHLANGLISPHMPNRFSYSIMSDIKSWFAS